jgi:hypothetical protein
MPYPLYIEFCVFPNRLYDIGLKYSSKRIKGSLIAFSIKQPSRNASKRPDIGKDTARAVKIYCGVILRGVFVKQCQQAVQAFFKDFLGNDNRIFKRVLVDVQQCVIKVCVNTFVMTFSL